MTQNLVTTSLINTIAEKEVRSNINQINLESGNEKITIESPSEIGKNIIKNFRRTISSFGPMLHRPGI